MIENLLRNLDTLLIYAFALGALAGGVAMIVLRHPMQVAIALVSTMVFLGGIYGLLGVHFIAAFQVLIYVGAVMVFMVYVIMLLDVRDVSYRHRFSRLLVPGVAAFALLVEILGVGLWQALADPTGAAPRGPGVFSLENFARTFLGEFWLHFELTSVLLVAAVVAALAVIKGGGNRG